MTRLDEETKTQRGVFNPEGGGDTDVWPELMSFPGRTPGDGYNFFTTAVYIDLVHTAFGTH